MKIRSEFKKRIQPILVFDEPHGFQGNSSSQQGLRPNELRVFWKRGSVDPREDKASMAFDLVSWMHVAVRKWSREE